jgi:phenylpropionate dioxygenase-like ring-hydroxylating dioxygenase large terminal subunit
MIRGWTPIALSRDIPAGVTRAVRLESRELVIWRGDGAAHVWEDRCPHRGMRLSLGFVRDNALNCLYHGWQYGAASSCIRIPAHPDLTVPPSIRANAYDAAEAGGMVWVRFEGDDALPELPAAATPVLSLAVEVDGLDSETLAVPFEGARLHLRWHRVEAGKIMVHAVLDGAADIGRATAFLRRMRNDMEQGAAA